MQQAGPKDPRFGELPASLHVLGHENRESKYICGEYIRRGLASNDSYPVYNKRGSDQTISFRQGRWLIAREGRPESDLCFAWAEASGSSFPCMKLSWKVWDKAAREFVAAPEVKVFEAPSSLSVCGRDQEKWANEVNGEYSLVGLDNGRPLYRKADGKTSVIRYLESEGRWLFSAGYHRENQCVAYAEARNSPLWHPGCGTLEWHFLADAGHWLPDRAVHVLDVPLKCHVMGRNDQAGNDRICGTYQLAGLGDGLPVYTRPGTNAMIRYSLKTDMWLIDCDALAEPGMLGRFLQWLQKGDAIQADDKCSAYAQAKGTAHPGHLELEWAVWEPQRGCHVTDPCVRSFAAPEAISVGGRAEEAENSDICGDYQLVGLHVCWPAYRKPKEQHAVRFCPMARRWAIDREGFRDSALCVAFAEAAPGAQHPGGTFQWNVYDHRTGQFAVDATLSISAKQTEVAVQQVRMRPETEGEAAAKRQRVNVEVAPGQAGRLGAYGA